MKKKLAAGQKKIRAIIPLIIVTLISVALVVLSVQQQKRQLVTSKADEGVPCHGPLTIQISSDGKTPQASVTLPIEVPTSYYLHIKTADGQPCSSNFELQFQNGRVVSEWGPYKSNRQGVMRLDLDNAWGRAETLVFAARPKGTQDRWSNYVTIVFQDTRKLNQQDAIDFTRYWIQKPGNVYIYDSANNMFDPPKTGTTYVQMEQPVSICNMKMIPWRFTKSNKYAYWGAFMPEYFNATDRPYVTASNINQDDNKSYRTSDLRWFIADTSTASPYNPSYNNYIWSYGFEEYLRQDSRDAMMNFPSGPLYKTAVVRSGNPTIPNYNLARKSFPYLPYIEANTSLTTLSDFSGNNNILNTCNLYYSADAFLKEGNPLGTWKMRAQWDTVSISNSEPGSFNYNGPALRLDHYEGNGKLTDSSTQFHRESWYFVKDVGLVKFDGAMFNNYAGRPNDIAPKCVDTSDCWDNHMQHPTRQITLKYYFDNPTFTTQVSSDGVNYASEATIGQGKGYYMKITNVPYTGWVEAQDRNGRIFKWRWADKGVVQIKDSELAGFPTGDYKARFRVWIPNEQFPNQTRVGDNTLPFSNETVIHIVANNGAAPTNPPPASPTPAPTPIPNPVKTRPAPTGAASPTPQPSASAIPSSWLRRPAKIKVLQVR